MHIQGVYAYIESREDREPTQSHAVSRISSYAIEQNKSNKYKKKFLKKDLLWKQIYIVYNIYI